MDHSRSQWCSWNAGSCGTLVLTVLWSYCSTTYCRLKRTQPNPKTKPNTWPFCFTWFPSQNKKWTRLTSWRLTHLLTLMLLSNNYHCCPQTPLKHSWKTSLLTWQHSRATINVANAAFIAVGTCSLSKTIPKSVLARFVSLLGHPLSNHLQISDPTLEMFNFWYVRVFWKSLLNYDHIYIYEWIRISL